MHAPININVQPELVTDAHALLGALVTDDSLETFRYVFDGPTDDVDGDELVNTLSSLLLAALVDSKNLVTYLSRRSSLTPTSIVQALGAIEIE
jgi:hypothetical protein